MAMPRGAGYIRLDGLPYRVAKDAKSGDFVYTRTTTPKKQVQSLKRLTTTGQSNLIEVKFSFTDGIGDESVGNTRDTMDYTLNLYGDRDGELVVLPGMLRIDPDDNSDPVLADINLPWSAPVFAWEQLDRNGVFQNFFLADHRAFTFQARSGMTLTLDEDMFFEGGTHPTGGTVFNNFAYAAMGGGQDKRDRFIRRRNPTDGTWTNDDNNTFRAFFVTSVADNGKGIARFTTSSAHGYVTGQTILLFGSLYAGSQVVTVINATTFDVAALAFSKTESMDVNNVLSAASNGTGGTRFTTNNAHQLVVNDTVFISNSTVVAYNGLWTVTAVTATTFDVGGLAFSLTAIALSNGQDSDVQAEQLAIVGDEMVRTYYDPTTGWSTSRVDIFGSNELLVANWTAGIGALNVGDKYSKPTALIATGAGELVMKPEGVFKYDSGKALYVNEIPELYEHRHPDNGRGSFAYKGWVYIPTIIGVLRWKNGIVQDITPGRGGMQGFDSFIGPIVSMAGDADRLYALVQPFNINQPQASDQPAKHYASSMTGGAPSAASEANVFDGDDTTYDDISTLTTAGALYFGSSQELHRLHLQFTMTGITGVFGNQVTNGATLIAEVWVGNGAGGGSWVAKTVLYDGTRGWDNTDNDPTTLFQPGDIVFGPRVDAVSGEDTWTTDANLVTPQLAAGFYWMRLRLSANVRGTVHLEEVDFGLHSANALEPLLTTEVANDHGGIMYVLSMTEEQGRGVIWRNMWALAVPDITRQSGRMYGGPQRAGVLKIMQPGFLRATSTGDRYLFIGLQNLSYLCPLGNHPDPTAQPYEQWYPYTGSGFDNGTRLIVAATPSTNFGLSSELKSLKEIEFRSEGVDLSGVEIWYRTDFGAWQFAGFADDCLTGDPPVPGMPFVFAGGAEPFGIHIAVALAYEADSKLPLRADRFFSIFVRAQPRPEMAETIRMTLELEYDQVLPGSIKRSSPHLAYEALQDLQERGTSAEFRNISGDIEYVHVLQVMEHATWSVNNKPKLTVDVIMAIVTPQNLSS